MVLGQNGKADPTQRGQGNGTTWLELAIDFQIATGVTIAGVTEAIPIVKQEAAIFALASMKVLRHMGAWGKTRRTGQGINTLVPMGAPRAAGISPAASMTHHKVVMSHL